VVPRHGWHDTSRHATVTITAERKQLQFLVFNASYFTVRYGL
jgi:hypothetical protein